MISLMRNNRNSFINVTLSMYLKNQTSGYLNNFNLNYPLVLFDFVGFSTPQYRPANRACSHVYQIHLTPPAAFVGFRTVYSQAMDALHILLLYQFHQSPTIGVPF